MQKEFRLGLFETVSVNAQTDVFTCVKHAQNVQICWCNRRVSNRLRQQF